MADKKISALTGATTPLAGTEVLPIVQGGATVKTTVVDVLKLNQPMFSAYASAAQTIAASSSTKLTLDVEEFDTNNNFSASRFTPTVAGYYQLSCCVFWNSAGPSGLATTIITKSGSTYKSGYGQFTSLGYASANVSALVYANGSTDYFEIFVVQSSATSQATAGGSAAVFFTGALVKYA